MAPSSTIASLVSMDSGRAATRRPGMTGSRPRNGAPSPPRRKQGRERRVTRLDRRWGLFLGRQRQIGPMQLLVLEAILDGRLHHREIGRDVEVARRVKRVVTDLQKLAPRRAAFGFRDLR